jgi:hypothetical protein
MMPQARARGARSAARLLPCALLVTALAGCGGADVPSHNGYRSATAKPWQRPTVLELDASLEAEVDDAISYPKRQRARWYAIDAQSSGDLHVQLALAELGDERDVDLAFEILDEGYRVVARADRDEDDAGDEQKTRTAKGLRAGRHYVHVYAQRRLDEADYTLQVSFKPTATTAPSNFPATVAFLGALPDVPLEDDAPPPAVAKPRRCKGKGCKKREPRPEPEDTAPTAFRARIAGITESPRGVTLRIDRGARQGVEVGWKGSVVSRDGKPIAGGSFEISRVSPGESFATVRASVNAVTSAKYVRLRPP